MARLTHMCSDLGDLLRAVDALQSDPVPAAAPEPSTTS